MVGLFCVNLCLCVLVLFPQFTGWKHEGCTAGWGTSFVYMFNTLAQNRYLEPWVVLSRTWCLVPGSCALSSQPSLHCARAGTDSPVLQPVPQSDPGICYSTASAGTGSALKLLFNLNSQQHSHVGTLQQAAGAHDRVCLAHWETTRARPWWSLWARGPRAAPSSVLRGGNWNCTFEHPLKQSSCLGV